MKPYITVLTPSYNKGNTIRRTYESLLNQTCFDFEWLIINDGSTDQTDEIVRSFYTDKFRIRYISRENKGLCRTYNEGVRMAEGELLYRLDPDDSLSPNAIELVLRYKHLLDDKNICALVFLAQFDNGEVVGCHPYKEKCYRSNFAKYRLEDKATGDRAEVVKTKALREFPWPTFGGEKFCLETLFWHPMAHKYDAYYINEQTYIREYNQNSITAAGSKTFMNNPVGTMALKSYMVRELLEYGRVGGGKCGISVFRNAVGYWRFGLHAQNPPKSKELSLPILWSVIAFLPGLFLYTIDNICPTLIDKLKKYINRLRNKDNFSNLTIKKIREDVPNT